MSEKTIQVFIDGVTRYFNLALGSDIKVGAPYLVENTTPTAFDYTGIIGITGPYKGTVYFTAPKVLLRHLLMSMGESDITLDNFMDVVGEIANTISGNARSNFGSEFMISVPSMTQGAPTAAQLPAQQRSFVIPIYWKSYHAAVVVCLERSL